MNLRRCPVCEGLVLEVPGPFADEWPRASTFARHLPANASKEPATHMDGACFGSDAPVLVAHAERTPVRDDEFDANGRPKW